MKYSIIGAGIGGLTTALAFENAGIDYDIYERAPKLSAVGAGIWLAPNALQVLESLGVLDEVFKKGNSIDRITIGKANLSSLSDSHQDFIKNRFGYTTIAIHRAELQKLLLDRIPKNKIHLGKSFMTFNELKNGKINILFNDNSEFETDYLIGADGISSKVRTQLFPNSRTRYTGQTCWRGVAEIELEPKFQNRGIELWGSQLRFGISRIAKNKVYWFAVALDRPNLKDEDEIIQKKLLKMFSDFHPLVSQLITNTTSDQIVRNDIFDLKPLKSWHKNKVCLLGDAGHATTPNMGQGGAQAIEDAYYLSRLIEKESNENVFELFKQIRQSKVNVIVNQSWSMGKMAHWKYGTGIRNLMLKNIPKKLMEKKMIELYQLK